MAPKILRALRATLFRRNRASKLSSCDTIASFYAGPEHLRKADAVDYTANLPTLIVTSSSQSEAMLSINYAAETEASLEDDVSWEEGLASEYTSDASSDAESTLSSVTSADALEDFCACTNST